ncbi:hypothetical protein [Streptomyces sp. NBC_00557]|uniref:hypothetical protein n=1 Tax=Streptomyces sp. NBC_00557 TaxID=2975776 RepID=UPI002E8050AB|nr:hypothetical protein [Streptomyces sp. NBC_00557]WUC39620.1 hypothetical protein OG956_38325 [Streptomyces sp. NBC_00557]
MERDVEDFEYWRTRAPENPERIGVLAAWAETVRLTQAAATNQADPQGRAALHRLLESAFTSGAAIPAIRKGSRSEVARTYLAGRTGASLHQVSRISLVHRLRQAVVERPSPCPLDVPVTGTVAGRPWRTHLDYAEAPALLRHLGTAAFIVCAYLTGMRPEESLAMRSGCCPDPAAGHVPRGGVVTAAVSVPVVG